LGAGFRCHQQAANAEEDAHNGFLAYLAETGVFGAAAAVILLWKAAAASLRRSRYHLDKVLLAASIGYLAHSLFERFIFNVGNPGSLLFILWITWAIKHAADRRIRNV